MPDIDDVPREGTWFPLVATLIATPAFAYVAYGDGTSTTRIIVALAVVATLFIAGVANESDDGEYALVYQDDTTKIEADGDAAIEKAERLAREHAERQARLQRQADERLLRLRKWYLGGGLILALVIPVLAIWGPDDRPLVTLGSMGLLAALAAMLFGYAVNFKLFGFISMSSTPSPISRQKSKKASLRKHGNGC